MRILILASKYFPAVGGLETAVRNIALELRNRGHDIFIVTNRYSRTLPSHETIDDIPTERLYFTDRYPKSSNPWIWFKYFVRILIAPASLIRLFILIKRFHPDVVHLHYVGAPSLYALLIKVFLKFNFVVSIHGSDVELYPLKSMYQKWILQAIFRAADFVTSNSHHLLSEAAAMTALDVFRKSIVVPMAFTSSHYDKAFLPHRHSVGYLFSAGRFVAKKGQDVLIEAYALLINNNEYEGDLILAGDGPEIKAYKKIVKKHHLEKRVHFFGFASSEQMASLLKGCDLFIVPSRLEAFGIVILEALYVGKKIVASRVGGITELMKENPDCLVSPGDKSLLAKKIKDILSGKSPWVYPDPNALKMKYSWAKVADDYLKIYEKVTIPGYESQSL